MKLKEEVKKEGMNKDLYDLFIDLIQFEINKLSFISSAKFYFYMHGMMNYKKFFKKMYKCCEKSKACFVSYLMNSFENIPEFTIPALNIEFESPQEIFEKLAELEDKYADKLNKIAETAFSISDMKTLAYILPKINEIDHIACRAMEAVKNEQNPLDLIENESNNTCETSR